MNYKFPIAPNIKYGIFDTKENCWMGDNGGPKIFYDFMLAQAAARVIDVRLKQSAGRSIVKEFNEVVSIKKDEIKAFYDTGTALDMLLTGKVL